MEVNLLTADVIETLTSRDFDELPFGAIQLDWEGNILFYNQYEASRSGRKPERVLGRNFFREVAPCTAVQEFEGRFYRGLRERYLDETFGFAFPFSPPRYVSITFKYIERWDAVWVFVVYSDL